MGHLREFDEFGVQYMGQPAQPQEGTLTGGTGFFMRDIVNPDVSYLGTRPRSRHRAPAKFASMWLKVSGLEPAHDVDVCYVASVYLPCVGSLRDQYADALLDLQEDVEHYLSLTHTVFLVGDFNVRVGSHASPAVPEALRSVALVQGETNANAHGRALLQPLFMDNSAEFLSGRTMSAPTCIGHGRNLSTLDVGTPVVDHVLRARRGEAGPPTLPPCITLDPATHGPALQLPASGQFR